MKNNTPITFLQMLILLSPLPFGCVGRIFSPLFYLLLLAFSLYALSRSELQVRFLHEKTIRRLFYAFLGFLLLQSIPLPFFLLKILSPGAARNLTLFKDTAPSWHPISLVPFETLIFAAEFLVFALFFWVAANLKFSKKEIFTLLRTLVLSAVLQSFFGLIKHLSGSRNFFLFFYEIPKNDPQAGFLTGTLGNPNHFAFYLEMILPLVLVLFFLELRFFEPGSSLREKLISAFDEKSKRILAYFAAVLLLGSALVLTGSRAGILTLVLSFMVFAQFSFYLRRSRVVRQKLKLFFIGITAVAIFFGIQTTADKFLSTKFENAGRFLRWPATMSMMSDYPVFGTGFGTYRYAYFLYDRDEGGGWSTHAHNDYLEAGAEGGAAGSLLFFSLIGMMIFSIFKMWTNRRHPGMKMVGIGIISSIFAAAFHSIFDFSLHIPANVFVFVLVLVLGVQIAGCESKHRGEVRK
ncbi:MAG: O-antigen ligase family protein [Candidatus Aminicenantes bacterium]|nr:O-antigen ligase family protein [Candidatus Aminicenantes bacterium]